MSTDSNGLEGQSLSNGCPIFIDVHQRCGETQTLAIVEEFKQLYDKKMKEIDADAGIDCLPGLQAKLKLQQEWIKDLTEQNEMLVRAVEELEVEATDRVAMLEEKLRNSAQYGSEMMQKYGDFHFSFNLDETFQKLVYLQSDVRNLLEFIRRVRDESKWSIDGLHFYDVNCKDLFGCSPCFLANGNEKILKKLEDKEKRIEELEEKIRQMPNEVDTTELSAELKRKNEEFNALKRSMMDMRNALTIEVAEKHDIILSLRRDVQQLEEQYRQSTKQTHFKDDIIKEMRKEIKLLKGQCSATRAKSYSPSSRIHKVLESSQNFHECCCCVRELCSKNVKNNAHKLHSKTSKEILKNSQEHYKDEINPTKQNSQHDNNLFIFISEENPTSNYAIPDHDISTLSNNAIEQFEINAQVTFMSKSQSSKSYKDMDDLSSTMPLNENVLHGLSPKIKFYSERLMHSKCVSEVQPVQPKPRSKLTASKILHESYNVKEKGGIFGIVENYNQTRRSHVNIPKHIPVKTFVNNLEGNAQENSHCDNESDVKKTSSVDNRFQKCS